MLLKNKKTVCSTAGTTVLFVPYVSDDSQRWNGDRRPLDYYTKRYVMDETRLTKDIDVVLEERGIKRLYILSGQNSDSGISIDTNWTDKIPGIKAGKYEINNTDLYPILTELRVHKTQREIDYLRMCTMMSSQAHVYVMRHIRPGMTEMQLEAMFKSWTHMFSGNRHMAYNCICGSGPNGSTLHYGHAGRPNTRSLMDGDMALLDMGGEYNGYATDLTRSYPVNGHFTPDQKAIFNAVRAAQIAVFSAMKPGISWPAMHRLSERVILQHLKKIGILTGSISDMMNANMGSVFMPHGLGHLIGLYVHDVGGYPSSAPARSPEPGLCWLRTQRDLEKGMVITVEPGIYFNDPWINSALKKPEQAKFINTKILARFRGTGGVRLEDDVLITEDGIENFTRLPSTVDEIEKCMAWGRSKK